MKVTVHGEPISEQETEAYVDYVKSTYPDREIKEIIITVGKDDYVDIKTVFEADPPFFRLRRITGYLTDSLDRWNDGKKAEEKDRVKHTVEE